MSGPATDDRVTDLLREADAAFAAGDADRYAALFAEDAQLLLLHGQPVKGRAAIRDRWRGRLIHFLRREADGAWRIWLIMNSHSQPVEPVA